jgi:putative Mg2+ transporter-C (MgtC) family protein
MSVGLFAALSGVREDFADITDVSQALRVLVRLLLAAVLGGAIGLERGLRGKAAGMRTHMLVAVGSAMFVLVPQQAGVSNADLSRVIQGLVAGIGFLGAGAILRQPAEDQVHGLTTAAGIWLTAAIGMAAGMGREVSAILCTVLALVVLAVMPPVESALERRVGPPPGPPPAGPAG